MRIEEESMRSRNIKPGFFKDVALGELPLSARVLFAGLWCLADREGRLTDEPRRIKHEVLPYDQCNVDRLLQLLHDRGFICRYEVDGQRFIEVSSFTRHQSPHHREAASCIPEPPVNSNSPGLSLAQARLSPSDSLIPDSLIPDTQIPDSDANLVASGVSVCAAENSPAHEDALPVAEHEVTFADFWQVYPRKVEEKLTRRNWETLQRLPVEQGRPSPADLVAAARNYAAYCAHNGFAARYIKHPASFLSPVNRSYQDWITVTPEEYTHESTAHQLPGGVPAGLARRQSDGHAAGAWHQPGDKLRIAAPIGPLPAELGDPPVDAREYLRAFREAGNHAASGV